jgi:hypothetical protein
MRIMFDLCLLYYDKPKLPTTRLVLHVNKTELNTSASRSDTWCFAFSYLANTEQIWEIVDFSSGVIMIRVNTEHNFGIISSGKTINI